MLLENPYYMDINIASQGGEFGEGTTPLMLAAAAGRTDVVIYMLEQGADPNICNRRGWNVMTCANKKGNNAVRGYLKGKGISDPKAVCAIM